MCCLSHWHFYLSVQGQPVEAEEEEEDEELPEVDSEDEGPSLLPSSFF